MNTGRPIAEALEGRQLWSATPVGIGHLADAATPFADGDAAVTVEANIVKPAVADNLLFIFNETAMSDGEIVTAPSQSAVETSNEAFSDQLIETDRGGNVLDVTLKMNPAGKFSLAGASGSGFSFDGRIGADNEATSGTCEAGGTDGSLQLSQEDQRTVRNARAASDDDDDSDDDEEAGETEVDASGEPGAQIIHAVAA